MPSIHLSSKEQSELAAIAGQNGDTKVLRRAHALLALNSGERPGDVAAENGAADVVALLLDKGINPEVFGMKHADWRD